jgi:hypothetical protein
VGKNDFDKQKSNITARRFGIRVEKHSRRATLQGSESSNVFCAVTIVAHSIDQKNESRQQDHSNQGNKKVYGTST